MILNIKKAIRDRNIEQKKLAEQLGITAIGLSQLINAKSNPTVRTLEKLANAIGCDVTDLFEHEYKPVNHTLVCPKCGARLKLVEDEDQKGNIPYT